MSVLRAGQAHCGRVHYGHELLYVLHQHSVEQPLVTLLDAHQIDVPVDGSQKTGINECRCESKRQNEGEEGKQKLEESKRKKRKLKEERFE